MKRALVLISLIILLAFPQSAHAHVLQKDGKIGGILHIDPDDDPAVGSASNIFLELKDTTGNLSPDLCDCTFTIKQSGTVLFTQPLFQGQTNPSLENIVVPFTFPKRGIYTLIVTGNPSVQNSFQPFTLTYDIRVAKENDSASSTKNDWLSAHVIHLLGVFGIILFIAVYTIKKSLSNRSKKMYTKDK